MSFFIYFRQPHGLSNYRGDSFIHPFSIIGFVKFWPEGHRERRKEFGSLRLESASCGLNQAPSDSYHNVLAH